MAARRSVRSRAFFVTSTIVLSVAYFSIAIGTWLIQGGRLTTSADVVAPTMCQPPFQNAEAFFNYPGNGSMNATALLPTSAGWTVTGGENMQLVDQPIHALTSVNTLQTTISRPIRPTREGYLQFAAAARNLNQAANANQQIGQVTVTLASAQGPLFKMRRQSLTIGTPGLMEWQRYDDLSGNWVNFIPNPGGAAQIVPNSDPMVAPVSWAIVWTASGVNAMLDVLQGTVGQVPWSYPDHAGPVTRVTFDSNGAQGNLLGWFGWPDGTGTPCISSVNPAQGRAGDQITLSGINFTPNGTTKVHLGTAPLVDLGTVNAAGSQGTFTVPTGLAAGTVSLKVTNDFGESNTVQFTVLEAAVTTWNIHGLVFEDLDGDGVLDSSESPLAGKTVSLSGDATATATTSSTGTFEFPTLMKDKNYTLTLATPDTHVATTPATKQFVAADFASGTATYNFGIKPKPTVFGGTSLICAADQDRRPVSENFELMTDGQTNNLGWTTIAGPNTSAMVRREAGKTGNGLLLVDTNSAATADAQILLQKVIPASDRGTVTFDIKPAQTNAFFALALRQADGTTSRENVVLYLWNDGTIRALDSTKQGDDRFVQLGTATYTANEWQRLSVSWTPTGVTISRNGQSLTTQPISYSFPQNIKPVVSLDLRTSADDQPSAGTVTLDNLEVPGCGSGLGLSVAPQQGPAPLDVTATATLPYTNLLNETTTTQSDVGATTGASVTQNRKPETGALEISDVPKPTGSPLDVKQWLYDLDQSKINQLQWKRTIPDNATVEAKLSWTTADDGTTRGTLLGGLGFIDSDGLFQDWVGVNDHGTDEGSYGSVDVAVRDGQRPTFDPAHPTQPEFTQVLPQTNAQTLVASSGSVNLTLRRTGSTIKIYVDNTLVKEHELTGTLGGIALGLAGLKDTAFGTLTIEALRLTNAEVGWNFGDGSQARCTLGTKCQATGISGESATVIKHTYTKPGQYQVTVSNSGQEVTSQVSASTTVTVTPPTGSGSNQGGGTVPTSSLNSTSSSGSSPRSGSTMTSLVSTGGNLFFNLSVALLLSVVTAYALLRRRHPDLNE